MRCRGAIGGVRCRWGEVQGVIGGVGCRGAIGGVRCRGQLVG